jgi:hypothetical protein
MEEKMKVKVFASICVLMFSTMVPAASAQRDEQGESITLSIDAEGAVALQTDSLQAESTGVGEEVFKGDDIRWLNDTGEPRIPWKVRTVLLPPDADLSSVACLIKQSVYEAVAGTWQVEPMPPVATWDENGQAVIVWPEDKRIVDGRDVDIYERDAFWPEEEARLSGKGRLRKWRLVEIAIPLIRYNPVSGELLQLANADITLDFQREVGLLDIDRPDPLGRARVQKIAANFVQAVDAYDKAACPPNTLGRRASGDISNDLTAINRSGEQGGDSPNPASTGYCIITTSAIQSASSKLNAFVSHKQSQGFNVQVVTESTWGGGLGDIAANNIRAWLSSNYFTNNILYVLLIGNPHPGTGAVPMKMCISDHPTDYFYAELTVDWDKDRDGIYGEQGAEATQGDEVEKYFEVFVGRIPYYDNINDLDRILQKTIDYENAPFGVPSGTADTQWRRNALLPMVPLGVETPSYQLGERIKSDHLEPKCISSVRIYDKNYGAIPPPEYLRSQRYPATEWSQGRYGLIVWATHGWSQGASGIISTSDTPSLNDSYPGATWQGSCNNSEPEVQQNLAYSILKNGGIATIGATRLSWYWVGENDFRNSSSIGGLGYQFAKRISEKQSVGQALYDTKEAMSFWKENYYVFNLYGDPAVVIMPDPAAFTISPTDLFYNRSPRSIASSHSRTYTLNNNSGLALSWTASHTADWFELSSYGGTIGAHSWLAVNVALTAQTANLNYGTYEDTIIFTDTTNGIIAKRKVFLEIYPQSLVGYWKLDETSGSTAQDSSGNGYDGTLQGSFTFDTASVAGTFHKALDFNGVSNYVETGKIVSDFVLSNAARTVTAWVYTHSFNDGGIYEMGEHSDGRDFSLRTRTTDNQWRVQQWGTGDIDFTFDSKNKWVHFAHVYDGSTTKIYANGNLIVNMLRTLNTGGTKTFKIGRWSNYYFDGVIDDVRIYNYALDISAIKAVMDGGRAENPRPLDLELNAPRRATLSWLPGANVASHDVYFGTSYNAVANATTVSAEYKGRQSETFYAPFMDTNSNYFWRIDEIVAFFKKIPGNVWSFTTGQSPGTITREVWTGVSGSSVADLTNYPLYPNQPDIREEITSFEGPVDWADNYGTRIHGFLIPPVTGDYTFWIASDNNSELWLTYPFLPKKIAEVPGSTNSRQWDKYTQQKSALVTLTAGKAYYIKALHKEGSGLDNIAVAWQGPGIAQQVISGFYLSPYDADAPTPNPMTWIALPHPTSSTSISMTATAASDPSGVEYYFACTSGGGHDSGWQDSPFYKDTDLNPNTIYTFTVTARDKSPNHNITSPSQPQSATTFLAGDFEPDNDIDFADYAVFASLWGQTGCGECGRADLDGDNDVDFGDLSILLADWLAKQP